jgi:cob(I)alamin adenosyltransferase
MSIYTKAGDSGTTRFGCCEMNKNHPTADAIGSIDELNSHLGVARFHVTDIQVRQLLLKIQNDLFILGAELYGAKNQKISDAHVQLLEQFIDENQDLIPNQFIIPGGSLGASELHVIRAVCRRAERKLVAIHADKLILTYINRLSDCLFVMALKENHQCQIKETFF